MRTASATLRVLLVHNYYQQPGGEDRVFHAEADLLRARGHDVHLYTRSNQHIAQRASPRLAVETVWSQHSRREIGDLIRSVRPDVAHFHNTMPLISPSAYFACRAAGVPVVQTLHNYRLHCPKATYFRDGRICETCRARFVAWPGVLYACYRGSRTATATLAATSTVHRLLGTWRRVVARFVVPSAFARSKLIEGGLPPGKVVVKPNFVDPDPGVGAHRGEFALFVGRLNPEKGVETLLRAWRHLPNVRLRIVGDGPLREHVVQTTAALPNVEYLGPLAAADAQAQIADAAVLVFPSEWYETFGLVMVEAFAHGTPVIAADVGGIREIVEPGRTGAVFAPGDPEHLAHQVERAFEAPDELTRMGHAARQTYLDRYTAERAYAHLLDVYAAAGAA